MEDSRADKIMPVIITDGMQNSSREYSADKVRSMIEHEKTKYGLEFISLGANMDAVRIVSASVRTVPLIMFRMRKVRG